MSGKIKKFPQKSEVRMKLLQEAATLENNKEFMEMAQGNPIKELLFIFKMANGHTHRVYPSDDLTIQLLTEALEEDFGIDPCGSGYEIREDQPVLPNRIVFHNRQAIGDILMFTCAIRDFKRAFPHVEVQVHSTAMHIWDHNPYINRETWVEIINPYSLHSNPKDLSDIQRLQLNKQAIQIARERDVPVIVYIGPGKATNASNRSDLHFANAYRISMETVLDVSIPQGPIRPDIYMTQDEYDSSPIIEPPYWLITAGEKGDWTCKTFPFEKWQQVVTALPDIKFVQLGSTGHKHPDLVGDNVINFIGKTQDRNTGIRDLFNLFNYCEGSMGLVSFQMHLAAAFNKPCIVIAGAREPVHFTRYPGQQYLASDGCLPCTIKNNDEPTACWFCKIERCPYITEHAGQKIPLCADLFSADDVVRAIMRYYNGGRLLLKRASGRSRLINVIKPPSSPGAVQEQPAVKPAVPKTVDWKPGEGVETTSNLEVVPNAENLWGMSFGGGAITDRDWEFMKSVFKEFNVKTVLEFGAGLSSLLMKDFGLDIATFETNEGWIKKVKELDEDCDVRHWNGVDWPYKDVKCDLVFVDGPAGGKTREFSTKIASEMADIVIVHDAGREWERKWQAQYLEPTFYLAAKGGHRCHLWKKGQLPKIEIVDSTNLVKFVFNGRGDGGAERSTRWMMQTLVDQGYVVQYISPNEQPSGTFRRIPVPGVVFSNDLSEIKKPCDFLVLYSNDWIWEFNKPHLAEAFSNLQAKRKVMAVNYKIGGVGNAPWTLNWDKYLFLNTELQNELQFRHKRKMGFIPATKAMAPPTDLTEYFKNSIDYGRNLRLIRHSSQGDAKYPDDFNEMLYRILDEVPECEIFLMPAPSFLDPKLKEENGGRVHAYLRNTPPVNEYLELGNVFWYKLPSGYTEGGPKVIMEAQASGLPIIADDHSGARDRLRNGGGYLCKNFDEHVLAIKDMAANPDRRVILGQTSRDHAEKNYDPMRWIDEILGKVDEPKRCDLTEAGEGEFICKL